jgi:hypothetical protein
VDFRPQKCVGIHMAADVSDNAGAFKDHGLAFLVPAGKTFTFEFLVPFQTSDVSCGLGLAVSASPAPALLAYERAIPTTAAAGTDSENTQEATSTDGTNSDTASVDAANTTRLARVWGVITAGASNVTVKLRFRREAAAAGKTATIKAGASLVTVNCG